MSRRVSFQRFVAASSLAALSAFGFVASPALAETPKDVVASFNVGPGASALRFARHNGELRVAPCRGAVCNWEKTTTVPLPLELLPLVDAKQLQRLDIGEQRAVIRLRIVVEQRAWEALLTEAKVAGAAPSLHFADWTGLAEDAEGELSGKALEIYPKEKGLSDVVLGTVRADVSLCGRPTLLDPKLLYPKDLQFHRIKLQRLSEAERAQAKPLAAVTDASVSGTAVSRALVASSAKGSPQALSDGDPATVWAEDRGGNGRGEFVVFRTPSNLPLSSFYWTYPKSASTPPPVAAAAPAGSTTTTAPAANGALEPALPKDFWVATDQSLFRVQMPSEALHGQRYRVDLPTPETTSCVALVLDSASVDGPDIDVSLAEFGARAPIDAAAIDGLISKLDDAEQDAAPLVDTLSALGGAAVKALRPRYASLSPAGRARALSVYDTLPCSLTARAYASAIVGLVPEEDQPAVNRLAGCGAHAVTAIARALKKANAARTEQLAPLLVKLAPAKALDQLVPALDHGNRARRRALREAISGALSRPEAKAQVKTWLAQPALSTGATVDLLRALGQDISAFQPEAAQRLKTLLAAEPEYRERYLLLEPMARLAPGDVELATSLRSALKNDAMAPVRARAARLLPNTKELLPALIAALSDPHVRVREAALENLAERPVESARPALLRVLGKDPWPLVRVASVKALARLAPAATVDAALATAASGDASAHVRRSAILALGSHNARAHRQAVRERLDDSDEDPYVRAAAAATLGTFCDQSAVDALTAYAKPITRLTTDEAAQTIARASLSALGRLAPKDLAQRLAMFKGDQVPPWARQVADAALTYPERCPR
jgi:hypothetical protein